MLPCPPASLETRQSANDGSEDSASSAQDSRPSDPITDAALALAEYILDGDFSEVLGK